MVINDEGIQNSDGHMTYYGKLWNCGYPDKAIRQLLRFFA